MMLMYSIIVTLFLFSLIKYLNCFILLLYLILLSIYLLHAQLLYLAYL